MAQKPNTIIEKTFTYDVPDDYLSQDMTLGKTAEWHYRGPDKIWVMVGKEDLKIHSYKDEEEDGEEYPTPLDMIKVFVDCNEDPLLATLCYADEIKDYSQLPQHEEELPCGGIYARPVDIPPDHVYDADNILFDPSTGKFRKPYPLLTPHVDWRDIREWRNTWLRVTDDKEGDHVSDMPDSLKQAWIDHRQALRDIPQVHGATNVHTFIDLTAAAPINRVGQRVLQLVDVTGINVGDDVGMRGWPVTDIFADTTVVLNINEATKQIIVDKNLISTPTEANSEIAFSPGPATAPWKVQPIIGPDGKG